MADDDTDSTVVESIIGSHIKERILENTGRETNLVAGGVIVGIDGLRGHIPLGLVHGLAEKTERIALLKLGGTLQVLVVGKRSIDVKFGIVAPLVGIAYFDYHRREFLLCFGLGLVRHPSQSGNTLGERLLKVLHECEHTLLVLLGEVFFHIHLSYRFAERTVYYAHCTFPQRRLLFLAGEDSAIEIERCIVEVGGQIGGCAVKHLPNKERLEVVKALLRKHFACFLKVCYLTYGEAVNIGSESGEILFPVDLRNGLLQVGKRHLVVVGNGVAQFDIVSCSTGKACLKAKDGLGSGLRVAPAVETEHTLNIFEVSLTDGNGMLVRVKIILFLAEGKTALILVEDIHSRVVGIGIHVHRPYTILHTAAEQSGELLTVFDGKQGIDGIAYRLHTFSVAAGCVHSEVVDVAYLLLHRTLLVLNCCKVLYKTVHLLEVLQPEFVKRAEAGIFVGKRIEFLPAAGGELIEVVLRYHGAVEVLLVNAC